MAEVEDPVDPDLVISRLPDEVWLEVLSYFTSLELCSLGLTCKSLLRLTRDPALWTEITLLGDAIASTETVQTLFRLTFNYSYVRLNFDVGLLGLFKHYFTSKFNANESFHF